MIERRKEHWIVFRLGSIEFRFDMNDENFGEVCDDLSTILTEGDGLYYYDHCEKNYKRIDIYYEIR